MDALPPRSVLLLIAGFLIGFGLVAGIGAFLGSEQSATDGSVSVLNCSDRYGACTAAEITSRPTDCRTVRTAEGEVMRCSRTSDGIGSVALITDSRNYVQGGFTDAQVNATVHVSGIGAVFDLEFLPDGRMLVTKETPGELILIEDGRTTSAGTIVDGPDAELMGLAVDPAFRENRYIYAMYTYKEWQENVTGTPEWEERRPVNIRISRFRLVNGSIQDETVLFDPIPGSVLHRGGRLEIGPDGKLYATTGDGRVLASPGEMRIQDTDNYYGKVLRLNRNGTVPEDNPFGNAVYAHGLKNPQSLAWHPETGTAYVTDHGGWRMDEVNQVTSGANLGWPAKTCRDEHVDRPLLGNAIPPIRCYRAYTVAPSGMRFVDDPGHPWHGNLFLTTLRGKHLRRMEVSSGTITAEEIFWVNRDSPERTGKRLRDVEYRDGALWIATDDGGIIELAPT